MEKIHEHLFVELSRTIQAALNSFGCRIRHLDGAKLGRRAARRGEIISSGVRGYKSELGYEV